MKGNVEIKNASKKYGFVMAKMTAVTILMKMNAVIKTILF